jgi:hypothetical protein
VETAARPAVVVAVAARLLYVPASEILIKQQECLFFLQLSVCS